MPSTTTPMLSRNICGGTPLHVHVDVTAPLRSITSNSTPETPAPRRTEPSATRPAEPDRGADGLVAGRLQLGRAPVVDEVLADAAGA